MFFEVDVVHSKNVDSAYSFRFCGCLNETVFFVQKMCVYKKKEMNFLAFGKLYKTHRRRRVNDNALHGKYRSLVSRFGLSAAFQARANTRKQVINAISAEPTMELSEFLRTRCEVIPGSGDPLFSFILHMRLLSDPSVEFVVKDSTRAQEPGIMMFLTEKALEEGFERMLLGYYTDGHILCMERAVGNFDIERPNEQFRQSVYEIATFLHRHNVSHGDWLVTGLPCNNLFLIRGLEGPAIGDFGMSSYMKNVYERLNDLQTVVVMTKTPAVVACFFKVRSDMGLPDMVNTSKEIARIEMDVRLYHKLKQDVDPRVVSRLEVLTALRNRMFGGSFALTPEENERATHLYRTVMQNLSDFESRVCH
jgi:hypothetical protein